VSQLCPDNGIPELLGVQYSNLQQLLEGLYCTVQLVRTSLGTVNFFGGMALGTHMSVDRIDDVLNARKVIVVSMVLVVTAQSL
jgi:hypothetical protein